MCDYSLASIHNRLATEGEELVVHRFCSGTLGLASPADVQRCADKPLSDRLKVAKRKSRLEHKKAAPDKGFSLTVAGKQQGAGYGSLFVVPVRQMLDRS